MDKKNVPDVRFPGFSENWKPCKYSDVIDLLSGQDFPPDGYNDNGHGIPYMTGASCIEGNGTLVERWTETPKCIASENDVLIVCKGSGYGKIAKLSQPKAHIARQFMALKSIPEVLDQSFNFHLANSVVNTIKQDARGLITGIAREAVLNTPVSIPEIEEQKQISSFFDDLDQTITLHQKKLDDLKEFKSGLLQKMFPQKGEKVPQIRFPGFTDNWEQRKFSDLYQRIIVKNDGFYGQDKIISVANMYFNPDARVTSEEYLKTYNIFEVGDIAFEGNRSKNFAHGRFVENTIGNGIVSHVFDVFKPKRKDHDLLYWKYAINNESFMRPVLIRCTKASTMMTNLDSRDFLKESILVPELKEQIAIGVFFDTLDQTITLHQKKIDDLNQLKSGLLQKMFI